MADSWAGSCAWDAMYAEFPAERDDSVAWDNKMAFWSSAIKRLCQSRKTAVFNLAQLPLDFQRYGKVPKCLGTVVQHMVNQGQARRLSFYVTEMVPEGSRWSVWDFIQKPITFSFNWFVRHPTTWFFRKLFSSSSTADTSSSSSSSSIDINNGGPTFDDEPYVIVEIVKLFADGVNEVHRNNSDKLVSYANLMQLSKEIVADEASFRLALLHLTRLNRCSITVGDDGQKIVRLVEEGDEMAEPSNIELKLFRLNAMAEKIEASIDSTQQLMARHKQSAKESLLKGNKAEALRFLKRKKQLESSILNKELTLDRIVALVTALEQTESHKQALDAYRSGMEAFKTIKQNCGLSVDEIDKTMLNMQEMLDDSQELERTMSMAFNSPLNGSSASDDELERELNELLDDSPTSTPRLNNPSSASASSSTAAAAADDDDVETGLDAAADGDADLMDELAPPTAAPSPEDSLQFPTVPSNDPKDSKTEKKKASKKSKKFGKAAKNALQANHQ